MCGIIAISRRKTNRVAPTRESIEGLLDLEQSFALKDLTDIKALIEKFLTLKKELSGVAGIKCLLRDPPFGQYLERICSNLESEIDQFELTLVSAEFGSDELEEINRDLIELKDLLWHFIYDRVRVAIAIEELSNGRSSDDSVEVLTSIQEVLTGIDRLEVRGRDSAGLHIMLVNHGLDLTDPAIRLEITHILKNYYGAC